MNGKVIGFGYTFPACDVTFQHPGVWLVQAFGAHGWTDFGEDLYLEWPEEPVLRQGRFMVAQPINNSAGYAYVHSKKYLVRNAWLPMAKGTPDFPFGLFSFTVEPVTVLGQLEEIL